MARIAPSIMIALAEPMPICPRLKVKEYMNMAGKSEEYPGPPAVIADTRSKLLMAMCARIMKALVVVLGSATVALAPSLLAGLKARRLRMAS